MAAKEVGGPLAYGADSWFDDVPVIGSFRPDATAAKLRELGDFETAEEIEREGTNIEAVESFGIFGPSKPKPWQHTAHAFGYIPLVTPGASEAVDIAHAGNIEADKQLKGARVVITLNELRVAEYPGGGVHHVLFDFYAQNQVAQEQVEHVHFNQTFRAQEGETVGSIGYPVFIGLSVPGEGASFRGYTVNVKNENDEGILKFLDSDLFKAGLKLATTAQPAIGPLGGMAVGLTRLLASRNKNVAVQDFFMGLDFGAVAGGARLREGTYVAVQIPERDQLAWDWEEWVFSPTSGRVVNRSDPGSLIPFNYVAFGVRRYEEG
jgi:hypothetical protein